MKKQLSGGVVAAILAVVGVIVVVLGWKALAPPSAPPAAHITKAMMAAHDKSAADIRADQMRRMAQAQGGR